MIYFCRFPCNFRDLHICVHMSKFNNLLTLFKWNILFGTGSIGFFSFFFFFLYHQSNFTGNFTFNNISYCFCCFMFATFGLFFCCFGSNYFLACANIFWKDILICFIVVSMFFFSYIPPIFFVKDESHNLLCIYFLLVTMSIFFFLPGTMSIC